MRYQNIELIDHKGQWWFEDPALAVTCNDDRRSDAKRQAWMNKVGAQDSNSGSPCLCKVVWGPRHHCARHTGYIDRHPVCQMFFRRYGRWFDHYVLFWLSSQQQYILTSQPYGVSLTEYQAMEQFATNHEMLTTISLEDAWWYPGLTPLIVWRHCARV